jgi:hypothetical protein
MKDMEMDGVRKRPKKVIALVSILVLVGVGFGFRKATKNAGDCRTKPRQLLSEKESSVKNSMTALVVISTYPSLGASTRATVKERVLAVASQFSNEKVKVVFSETEMKIANYFDLSKRLRDEITKSIVSAVASASTPEARGDREMVQRFAGEAMAIAYEQGKCLPVHMFDRKSPYNERSNP